MAHQSTNAARRQPDHDPRRDDTRGGPVDVPRAPSRPAAPVRSGVVPFGKGSRPRPMGTDSIPEDTTGSSPSANTATEDRSREAGRQRASRGPLPRRLGVAAAVVLILVVLAAWLL
jgi:hypothetical protein